jgi:hypothetical protein
MQQVSLVISAQREMANQAAEIKIKIAVQFQVHLPLKLCTIGAPTYEHRIFSQTTAHLRRGH